MRGLAFEAVKYLLSWSSKNIIDSVYLIELVFAWEEWFFGDEFEEYASEAPDVHFLIVVAVGHETLGGSVPAGGDVVSVG